MKVLVDSSVWSLAIRNRTSKQSHPAALMFKELIGEGRVVLIGPIRQEVLSGVRNQSQFRLLKEKLQAWSDLEIETEDYERAAEHFNTCRAKGIQGTHTDFLICAMAEKHQLAILTTDKDFMRYASLLPIRLLMDP